LLGGRAAELGQDDQEDAEVEQHEHERRAHRLFFVAGRQRLVAELAVAHLAAGDVLAAVADREEVEVLGRVGVTAPVRAAVLATLGSGLGRRRRALDRHRARSSA
jgi:hypothetical protein